MIVSEEKNELIIELGERIEYTNAGEIEAEIFREVKLHPDLPVCLDADKLIYISSAGLRIMIKLRKSCAAGFSIRNVSPEVYEVFEMTGLNTIITIRKKLRRIDVDGCEVIGKGASGTVYKLDAETVVKVYHKKENVLSVIEEEQKKARQAFLDGVPTAIPFDIVRAGEGYGAVFEMIDARNLGDIVKKEPERMEQLISKYAAFLRSLHSIDAHDKPLPGAVSLYLKAMDEFGGFLSEKTAARIRELLNGMPEDSHLLHGDIQLKNVMLSGDEMMLIDMDHLCTGNPVFEFAALYATYIAFNEVDPLDTQKFLGIDRDTAARLVFETLREYLRDPGGEELNGTVDRSHVGVLPEVEKKVRTAGYLRLLMILVIEWREEQSEKKERGIRHAASMLEELAFQVEGLAI